VRGRSRGDLHRALAGWMAALESLPESRKLRWSLDVDPGDLF
jgi:primosomal protein N' (replication factor Y)